MAAVTKNRNFFKWPKLLYFKPECELQLKFELILTYTKAAMDN
jgi:hypothetical protein